MKKSDMVKRLILDWLMDLFDWLAGWLAGGWMEWEDTLLDTTHFQALDDWDELIG